MQILSKALASELEARLMESAEVVEGGNGYLPIQEQESRGARLFVEGAVQEASWIHPRSGGGSYRLKVELSATLVRADAPDLQGFWKKTVEVEEAHRGRPGQDLARVMRKAFGEAVEGLGKALEKEPAGQVWAQAGQ